MKRRTDSNHHLAAAALDLAGKGGWPNIAAAKLAKAARVPEKTAADFLAAPQAVMAAIAAYITAAALSSYRHDARATPRDALFDLLMRRFDALQRHRAGILALIGAARRDMAVSGALLCALRPALIETLRAARLDAAGPLREARIAGLGLIYLGALTVWRNDITPDMAPTMAALDAHLRRADSFMQKLASLK